MPLGLAATLWGLAGVVYAVGSVALGSWLVFAGMKLYVTRSDASARGLFLASIAYLPLLLGLMVLDRNAAPGRVGTSVAALTTDAGG